MAVDESGVVEENQGIDGGWKHLANFLGRERTQRKNLCQILFGIFHDNIKKVRAVNLTAARFKQPNQVRMRKLGDVGPSKKLNIFFKVVGGRDFGRNQFDGGFLKSICIALSEKYCAVRGSAEPLLQREFAINDAAFPCFRDIDQTAHRTGLAERLFYASRS